jgi:hypothetical protein
MNIRGWGLLAMLLGGLAIFGADTAALGDSRAVWGGGIVFAGGLVLIALSIGETVVRRRFENGQAITHLERLAQLRDRGILTDDEFLSQKQKILNAEMDDETYSILFPQRKRRARRSRPS